MTDEQILELAKTCGFTDANVYGDIYWDCWEKELLEFAHTIYENGFDTGREYENKNPLEGIYD